MKTNLHPKIGISNDRTTVTSGKGSISSALRLIVGHFLCLLWRPVLGPRIYGKGSWFCRRSWANSGIPLLSKVKSRASNLQHGFLGLFGWTISWRSFSILLISCFPGKAWYTFPYCLLKFWNIWKVFLSLSQILLKKLSCSTKGIYFPAEQMEEDKSRVNFLMLSPESQVFPSYFLHLKPSFL